MVRAREGEGDADRLKREGMVDGVRSRRLLDDEGRPASRSTDPIDLSREFPEEVSGRFVVDLKDPRRSDPKPRPERGVVLSRDGGAVMIRLSVGPADSRWKGKRTPSSFGFGVVTASPTSSYSETGILKGRNPTSCVGFGVASSGDANEAGESSMEEGRALVFWPKNCPVELPLVT